MSADDGALVGCVATAGAPVTAIAVQGGVGLVWLAAPTDRALYRVHLTGTVVTASARVSIDNVIAAAGDELVGPIAVGTSVGTSSTADDANATIIFATVQNTSSGAMRAVCVTVNVNASVAVTTWSVDLPGPVSPGAEHGISTAASDDGMRLIYTAGGTVAAVGSSTLI